MKKSLTLVFLLALILTANATHNRSGEILYKRIAPFTTVVGSTTVQVYTYSITVIKYTDHGSLTVADRCMDTVYFGDGQSGLATRINGTLSCNCGTIACGELIVNSANYKVKKNIYTIIHTYAGAGTYMIRSSDPNRNGGIHNIPNSVSIPFCIESIIVINTTLGTNASPVLSNPPTDQGLVGNCMYINCCAYDADGDSLSYELSTCKDGNGQTIAGYFLPETGTGGNIDMNAVTGLLTWCTPQFVDVYNLAIIVKEWRKTSCNGTYQLIGQVLRDQEIIIGSGTSATFSSTSVSDICVKAGAVVMQTLSVNSNGAYPKVYGVTASFTNSPAKINPTFINSNVTATYSWQTLCSQARKQAYDVYLVFDSPGITVTQKFYKKFRVTVLPPSPFVYPPQVDTGKVTLNWNSCMTNAAGYNIYRKTGTNTWTPGSCEQGVSAASGFVLVGVASSTANSFTDNNVWPILNGTTAHYVVTAFTEDCAESIADNAQTVALIVGMKENYLSNGLKVYPNPFNDKIEIDFDLNKAESLEVKVYSMDGKLLKLDYIQRNARKLELVTKNLNPGIYLLQIKMEAGLITKKLIKEQ